ncbi:transposase domain-containing protein [Variovorax sp. J22R115]|uniref:transposase domain-containing protein n=1 Tax=Variovorax sp. J22R115 TaxID=3053509 RepID=UPI002576C887|nr:transposase domain-containing protein [Variovorax sp. J22R115]MDM0053742.1 transposase domain-containing protein [Variovorax sp. J22R115]
MTDKSRLSVGLYIAAASLHERRSNGRKPAPAKAFGANRIKLHEKDDHPFLDNGTWPLDSNPVENAIRPFVVGRRSWLFADTVGGANASANLYSLIETAKANNVEPYRYLVALFKKLPLAQTVDDYEALLPWNIALPTS